MRFKGLCVLGALLLAVNIASAQEINEVLDSVNSSLKANSVKDAALKIQAAFKAKKASADSLVGTWTLSGPAVYATKGNMLLKLAENAAAGTLEKVMAQYLEKSHINSENTSFTFHSDGTFERQIAGRPAKGVWMTNGEKLMLGMNCVLNAEVTTHLDDNELMFLIDADKLVQGMITLGALKDSNKNKVLKKLAKSVPGLQGGISLVKKQ